jgi:ubiquinone/menaquinone biosynthesis C-methylase UbiE
MENNKNSTGERLETFINNESTFEHLHRYAMAITMVKGKVVLDIASGEGYGSNLLAMHATSVVGVDIDNEVVEMARKKYVAANLEYKTGSADSIPLHDQSVDVVVSFETLEHHDKHQEMFMEIKRVLKVGGILIISTPDKKNYSDEKGYKNPFHVKELYFTEFKFLVNSYFTNTRYYYQNFFKGSVIVPENNNDRVSFFEGDYSYLSESNNINSMYILAIATDINIFMPDSSIFLSAEIEKKQREKSIHESELTRKEIREETIRWITNSWSYKIGSFLLGPFKLFNK